MNRLKIRILGVAAALLLAALCIYLAKSSQFVYNDEHADGNTAGNLMNQGLFCQYDGKIYFSNLNDDGALYVMDADLSNFKKLSNDKVSYLNVAGNHIIYSKENYEKKEASSLLEPSAMGIYRCTLDGNDMTALDTAAKGMVHQYGNQIYYQTYTDENVFRFYTMDIKGENKRMLLEEAIVPGSIVNNTLYYAGTVNDSNIHTLSLSSETEQVLLEGRYYNITANNGYLYMMDVANNYSILRTDLDGKNKETLVSSRTCTFNISADNGYLYYQVDDAKNNGIYCMNLSTGKAELLLGGNYSNLSITEDYLFFTDIKETAMYAVRIGENEDVHQFNPPSGK